MSRMMLPPLSIQNKEWMALFKQKNVTTYNQSLIFVKKLTAVALSTIVFNRGVFASDQFDNFMLDGLPVKLLRGNHDSKRAFLFTTWIKSAFQAIEKKYMKELVLEINSMDDKIIEFYTFNYSYEGNKAVISLSQANSKTQKSLLQSYEMEEISESTWKILRSLHKFTNGLKSLPEKYAVQLRIMYYDDVTPSKYEPKFFSPGTPKDMDKELLLNGRGGVKTKHHAVKVSCASLLNSDLAESTSALTVNVKNKKMDCHSSGDVLANDTDEESIINTPTNISLEMTNFRMLSVTTKDKNTDCTVKDETAEKKIKNKFFTSKERKENEKSKSLSVAKQSANNVSTGDSILKANKTDKIIIDVLSEADDVSEIGKSPLVERSTGLATNSQLISTEANKNKKNTPIFQSPSFPESAPLEILTNEKEKKTLVSQSPSFPESAPLEIQVDARSHIFESQVYRDMRSPVSSPIDMSNDPAAVDEDDYTTDDEDVREILPNTAVGKKSVDNIIADCSFTVVHNNHNPKSEDEQTLHGAKKTSPFDVATTIHHNPDDNDDTIVAPTPSSEQDPVDSASPHSPIISHTKNNQKDNFVLDKNNNKQCDVNLQDTKTSLSHADDHSSDDDGDTIVAPTPPSSVIETVVGPTSTHSDVMSPPEIKQEVMSGEVEEGRGYDNTAGSKDRCALSEPMGVCSYDINLDAVKQELSQTIENHSINDGQDTINDMAKPKNYCRRNSQPDNERSSKKMKFNQNQTTPFSAQSSSYSSFLNSTEKSTGVTRDSVKIACICEHEFPSQETFECDVCNTYHHVICYGFMQNSNAPTIGCCTRCAFTPNLCTDSRLLNISGDSKLFALYRQILIHIYDIRTNGKRHLNNESLCSAINLDPVVGNNYLLRLTDEGYIRPSSKKLNEYTINEKKILETIKHCFKSE